MDLIDEFLKKKLKTNYNTKKSYRTNINKYFTILNKDINTYFEQTPEEIQKDLIDVYQKLIDQGKSLLVIRTIFNSVKQYLCKMDKRCKTLDFWDDLKDNTRNASPITEDDAPNAQDIKKVLQHGNTRARAMFLIQSCTGCRIGELISFYPEHVHTDETPTRISFKQSYDPTKPYKVKLFTKNKKKRDSFLTVEATNAYNAYMKERNMLFKKSIKKTHPNYRPVKLTGEKETDEKILNEYIEQDQRVFPMSDDQARGIWSRMVEKSGLYKKDSNTNRLTLHPHCLRGFFRSYLNNRDLAEHLMGHSGYLSSYRNKKTEDLGKEFLKYAKNVSILETSPDLTEVNKSLVEKDKQINEMQQEMQKIRMELLEVKMKQVQELQRKELK